MNNTSFSIVIPKPCHEDWNKMTPDQKGAFCGSCQKSVYDFTGKTDEEVIAILEKNKEKKICGRFDSKQLERPIEKAIPNYLLETNYSRLQTFAMALFLVFGSILFNCETISAQKVGKIKITEQPVQNHPIQGEMIAYPEPTKITGDTVITEPKQVPVMGGPKFVPVKPVKVVPVKQVPIKTIEPRMGDVCIMPTKGEMKIIEHPKPVEKPIQKDTVIKEVLMGKVAFHNPVKPVVVKDSVIKKTAVIKKDTVIAPEPKNLYPIMGMIAYRPEHPVVKPAVKDTIVPIVKIPVVPVVHKDTMGHVKIAPKDPAAVKDSASVIKVKPIVPEMMDAKAISLEVMPNPSNGKVMLRYTLKEKNMTVIELFNINGSKVKTLISSQQLYEGIYNSSFDISDLQDGIYFCQMRSGERTVSSKVILTK